MKPGMHVVVTGNPIDGFRYIGPFKTGDDAVEWADLHPLEADWWIAPLEAQSEWDASVAA